MAAAARTPTLRDMRRSPPRLLVNPFDVDIGEFEPDLLFHDFYRRTHGGRAPLTYSRVSTDRIQRGFNRAALDGLLTVVSSTLDPSSVQRYKRRIRTGARPPLYLYRDDRSSSQLICSDDELTLQAYRELGISKVPAIIMDARPDDLETTGLEFVNLALPVVGPAVAHYPAYQRFVIRQETTVVTLAPDPLALSLEEMIARCRDTLDDRLQRLRLFHLQDDGADPVHYHHALASALARSSRMVEAIDALVRARVVEQASTILRSLYELSLSMYLDWLAPEELGDMFLRHARMSKAEVREEIRSDAQRMKDMQVKGTDEAIACWGKSITNLYSLVATAAQKGQVSPLRHLHGPIYSTLSSRSHQDYRAGSSFFHALQDRGAAADMVPLSFKDDTDRVHSILPIVVGQIVGIIDGDVGVPN